MSTSKRPLQKDQSLIASSDERIHLIENRAPVLSPIFARADPLAHQTGQLPYSFLAYLFKSYRRRGLSKIRQPLQSGKLDASNDESYCQFDEKNDQRDDQRPNV